MNELPRSRSFQGVKVKRVKILEAKLQGTNPEENKLPRSSAFEVLLDTGS